MINPGFNIDLKETSLEFEYGIDVFGPDCEKRKLEDIRKTLLEKNSNGPEVVYSIAMDVGKVLHQLEIEKRNLLYGIVIFSKGKIGDEPVRSQGHIHSISKSCMSSTPEVYEILNGNAIIYMQEYCESNPGRCYAVYAKEKEVVIVPPNWAHFTVNANPNKNLVFGAWCVRDYGFDYDEVRKYSGLAFYPIYDENDNIKWIKNKNYDKGEIIEKKPRNYEEFNIDRERIYLQFENDFDKFMFVSNPNIKLNEWINFIP